MSNYTKEKLEYLKETKGMIREAIESKGQTVSDSDTFRSYAGKILAITGGGSSDELRYVTFMNDDGTVEYGKKAVATGDDCADPIARGIFSTPTKESTAQYSYTFSGGWATTPNGGIDSNALKAVEEDRTVYANFISAVRYYTITYYDSDGTTVLKTESLAYGSTLSYTPEKDGHKFAGWEPALTTVTGDANYIAKWKESILFANASWETIAAKSADGTASETWKIGDTKTVKVGIYNVTVEIAGFNIDTLADGSGTAGITLITSSVYPETTYYDANLTNTSVVKYMGSNLSSVITGLLSKMPTELQGVIKSVKKYSYAGTNAGWQTDNCKVWALSANEINLPAATGGNTAYEKFANGANLYGSDYWLRDSKNPEKTAAYYRTATKAVGYASCNTNIKKSFQFGFCI